MPPRLAQRRKYASTAVRATRRGGSTSTAWRPGCPVPPPLALPLACPLLGVMSAPPPAAPPPRAVNTTSWASTRNRAAAMLRPEVSGREGPAATAAMLQDGARARTTAMSSSWPAARDSSQVESLPACSASAVACTTNCADVAVFTTGGPGKPVAPLSLSRGRMPARSLGSAIALSRATRLTPCMPTSSSLLRPPRGAPTAAPPPPRPLRARVPVVGAAVPPPPSAAVASSASGAGTQAAPFLFAALAAAAMRRRIRVLHAMARLSASRQAGVSLRREASSSCIAQSTATWSDAHSTCARAAEVAS